MNLIRKIGINTFGKIQTSKQNAWNKEISWWNEKILKHQNDQNQKIFYSSDLKIHYKRPYELLHSYNEIFYREIYKFNTDIEAPLIIDCGSNIGLSVLYFKSIYPKSHIIAFEPDEENFRILQTNTEANSLTHLDLYKKAVWIKDGNISFQSKGSEASRIMVQTPDTNHTVSAIRLSSLLSNIDSVQFLKIDIEGAEYEVIKDCTDQLKKIDNLFLEYHGKVEEIIKLNEILSIISNAGFDVYIENAATSLSSPFIEKRSVNPYDVQLNLYCYRK